MSAYETALRAAAPWQLDIPEPLSQAWNFMESRGWSAVSGDGTPVLTAYSDARQLGPVFTVNPFPEGWVSSDDPEANRLVIIAEGSHDGDEIAIWKDNTGQQRFVCLCSDAGKPARMANSAIEFLQLLAVGYDDWVETSFGKPPSASDGWDPESGAADFREWLSSQYEVEIPEKWDVHIDPELSSWLEEHSPHR